MGRSPWVLSKLGSTQQLRTEVFPKTTLTCVCVCVCVCVSPLAWRGGVPWSHRPIGQMGKLRPGKAKGLLWATVAQWEDRSLEPGSTDSQLVFFLCCRVSLCARTGAWGQGVVSELLCSLK